MFPIDVTKDEYKCLSASVDAHQNPQRQAVYALDEKHVATEVPT